MDIALNNFIEMQGYLILVCCVYQLGLKQLTFYRFNRYFLLVGSILSCIIPFLDFLHQQVPVFVSTSIPTINVSNTFLPSNNTSAFTVVEIICITSLVVTCGLAIFQVANMFYLLKGEKLVKNGQKYVLSEHKKIPLPFTLFNRIVVDKLPLEKSIEIHERAHVTQLHYVDLILLQLITWVNWFNPFAWKLLKSVQANHELLADQAVLNQERDLSAYQHLILSNTFQVSLPFYTNSFFNQSIIKQRIMMMTKKQSNKKGLLKALWALPIALFIFVACGENEEQGAPVVLTAEVMPEYKGGTDALFHYLSENIVYPEAAIADSLSGTVYVQFVIDKKGNVTDTKIKKGVDPRLDDAAVKVIESMPAWTPGQNEGKPVAVQYMLPVRYTLK